MKYKKALSGLYNRFINTLTYPNKFLSALSARKLLCFEVFSLFYIGIGIIFDRIWEFPRFYEFGMLFVFIGALVRWATIHFSRKMSKIAAALSNQPAAKKANSFFFRYCTKSVIYIVCPTITVLVFGIGGCAMFGALNITPTLIWILILFSCVVYQSIVGYLQYVSLAMYIYNLAHGTGTFCNISKEQVGCIPAEIEWLQTLTKLTHTYRNAFFTLGSAYIVAFGAFCWFPEMKVNTSSCIFYILWAIIFAAIVFFFPIVSLFEYLWIKEIVSRLKKSCIQDLHRERSISENSKGPFISPASQNLLQLICETQIIMSKDYPASSHLATCYAVLLGTLNFGTAVFSFLQGVTTVLLQIP